MDLDELTILNYSEDGKLVIDRALTILFCNATIERWLNLKQASLVGRKLHECFPNLDRKRYTKRIEQVFNNRAPVKFSSQLHQYFIPVPLSDNQFQTQQTTIAVAESRKSQDLYALITIQDVTNHARAVEDYRQLLADLKLEASKRESAEAALREQAQDLMRSNAELETFAYSVSHDLKDPLRAINNYAEWIQQDCVEILPPKSRQHFDRLRQQVRRMDTLLNDLLAYSRAGQIHGAPEQLDTKIVVTELVDMLLQSDEMKVEVDDKLPLVVSPRAALESVLQNLISNAIKHHDKHDGWVRIYGQEHADCYEFCVADNGPGIEHEYHERVFDMFQTLQSRDRVEGTGMGLALVKKISESRGGTVELDATPGVGSTFRVTWPKALRPK